MVLRNFWLKIVTLAPVSTNIDMGLLQIIVSIYIPSSGVPQLLMFPVVGRSADVELRPMKSTDDSFPDLGLSHGN